MHGLREQKTGQDEDKYEDAEAEEAEEAEAAAAAEEEEKEKEEEGWRGGGREEFGEDSTRLRGLTAVELPEVIGYGDEPADCNRSGCVNNLPQPRLGRRFTRDGEKRPPAGCKPKSKRRAHHTQHARAHTTLTAHRQHAEHTQHYCQCRRWLRRTG